MSLRCWQSLCEGLENIELSSANKRWEIDMCYPNLSPCIFFCLSTCTGKLENASAHIIKRYGDKGHHCLNPLLGVIIPLGVPLMITENNKVVIQFITNLILFSLKFNLLIVCIKKAHSTLSYVLLISSFSATRPFVLALLCLILWRHSYQTIILSVINLLEMKALGMNQSQCEG